MSAWGSLTCLDQGKGVESHVAWLAQRSHCVSHAPACHLKGGLWPVLGILGKTDSMDHRNSEY